jgi:hypothetical protein
VAGSDDTIRYYSFLFTCTRAVVCVLVPHTDCIQLQNSPSTTPYLYSKYDGYWNGTTLDWKPHSLHAARSAERLERIQTIHKTPTAHERQNANTQFPSALLPMTVLINGRGEPRVVLDLGPLLEGACLSPFFILPFPITFTDYLPPSILPPSSPPLFPII